MTSTAVEVVVMVVEEEGEPAAVGIGRWRAIRRSQRNPLLLVGEIGLVSTGPEKTSIGHVHIT